MQQLKSAQRFAVRKRLNALVSDVVHCCSVVVAARRVCTSGVAADSPEAFHAASRAELVSATSLAQIHAEQQRVSRTRFGMRVFRAVAAVIVAASAVHNGAEARTISRPGASRLSKAKNT